MKNYHKPTGKICPLCNQPTTLEWIDCGHRDEGCLTCNMYEEYVFEFARKVKDKYEAMKK